MKKLTILTASVIRQPRHLVVGPLIVLIAILPMFSSTATANSPTLKCGEGPCPFSLSGGPVEMNFGGSQIRCEVISGRGELGQASGQTTIDLENCREGVTVFGLRCGSWPQPNGLVQTGALGTQLMRGTGSVPKLMLLGLRVSFNCANVLPFTIEGFLVGHLDRGNCNRESSRYLLEPVLFAHGHIGSEPVYDVYVAPHRRTYKIAALWRMKFRHSVTLRC